jgi:iron-sulfur cluster assembly accessory protein
LVITLTETAADKLQNIMQEKGLVDYGLRVFVSGGGCSGLQYGMTFAEGPMEGDQVFEDQSVKLIVDPASLMYLMGAEIDYIDSLMGGGFRIENPNAVHSCSCGSSFRTAAGERGTSCRH